MLVELSEGAGEGISDAGGADRLVAILDIDDDRSESGGVTGSRGSRRNQTGVSGFSRVNLLLDASLSTAEGICAQRFLSEY